MEHELRRLGKSLPKPTTKIEVEVPTGKTRFSAKGLVALRQKLGLSANDIGRLVGASSQSVYNWEGGDVRPHAKYLPAIAALRAMGKKEVAARLAAQTDAKK